MWDPPGTRTGLALHPRLCGHLSRLAPWGTGSCCRSFVDMLHAGLCSYLPHHAAYTSQLVSHLWTMLPCDPGVDA